MRTETRVVTPNRESERLLAERAAEGDRGAAQELGERVFDTVKDTVRYLSYGHRDTDDFVQVALIEVVRSARSFTGQGSLRAWARRITIRTTMRQLKKLRGRDNVVRLVPETPDPHHDETLAQSQVRARLAGHMQSLPPERRVVVMLRLVYGLSIDEIASETNTRVRTVRFRLLKGTERLRKLIARDPVLRNWREVVGS